MLSSSPYGPAGYILNEIWNTNKGLKSLAYNVKGELTISKTTYAQCSHVLANKSTLDTILSSITNPKIEAKNKGLLYVLLYELLLGPNKSIRGGGALKRQLMKRKPQLISTLNSLQQHTSSDSNKGGSFGGSDDVATTTTIPRYVRVNTLITSTDDILSKILKNNKKNNPKTYIDRHIPDLIVMEPTSTTRELLQDFVVSNKVILQDKSSCFSALCLVHGFDTTTTTTTNTDVVYLDACAAPGNKTSHLAALVDNNTKSNKIYALDKSKERFKLLQRRMKELTQGKVQCYNMDFLSTTTSSDENNNKNKFSTKNVKAILLDPSCSGSGMISNSHQETNINRDPKYCNDRIKALANFQFQALKHATSSIAFPKVDRVVYSTCSVYVEENENVVRRFLSENDENWELIAPKCLQNWDRRGLFNLDDDPNNDGFTLTKEQVQCLIRVNPEEDGTNGFFVACLQKKKKKRHKNQKQGGESSSYEGPILPEGMEYYENQFDDTKKNISTGISIDKIGKETNDRTQEEINNQVQKKKKKQKQNPTRNKNNGDDDDGVKKSPSSQEDTNNDSDKKRKRHIINDGDDNNDASMNKKKAKKLEWKRRQRQKKLERMQQQQTKKTQKQQQSVDG